MEKTQAWHDTVLKAKTESYTNNPVYYKLQPILVSYTIRVIRRYRDTSVGVSVSLK